MELETIGFIGLGAMGSHSARRLAAAGHRVAGYDVRRDAVEALASGGVAAASSPAQAVEQAGLVVLFVVNGAQVEQLLFGPDGIVDSVPPRAPIVSCVTMSPAQASEIGRRCRERGRAFVDAPVSGGVAGAEQGTLTIMAAAPPEVIAACRPVLATMGSRLMVAGDRPGQGSMLKTINQLLCGVHIAAAGEAFALAERAGLDIRTVFDVVSQSAASSWMLRDRGPRMVARDYDSPKSAVDIFVKDLGIVVDVARNLRFPVPIAATALQGFLGASADGLGAKDDAAVVEWYRGFLVG